MQAVISINHHKPKGAAPNQAKVQAALALKPQLQQQLNSGTQQQREAAAHYLQFIDHIESAIAAPGGPQFNRIPRFAQHSVSHAGENLVQALARHMEQNGASWQVIERYAAEQSASTIRPTSLASARWVLERLNIPPGEFYNPPPQRLLSQERAAYPQGVYDRSMTIHHAFVQELLASVAVPGNDRARKLVRILRGESGGVPGDPPVGASVDYPRRVLASGSHARHMWSGVATITTVEHSRIFGVYWLERMLGSGFCFFHRDRENEFVYIGQRRQARIVRTQPMPPTADDATLWESELPQEKEN